MTHKKDNVIPISKGDSFPEDYDEDILFQAEGVTLPDRRVLAFIRCGGGDVNQTWEDRLDATPLMLARSEALTRRLLAEGADVRRLDSAGRNALGYAGKEKGAYRALVEAGCDLEQASDIRRTPLHLQAADPDALEVLVQAGANVDAMDGYGLTPLMMACGPRCLKVLVDGGASLDLQDRQGRTALMVQETVAAMKVLLDAGARTDLANRDGDAALHLCLKAGKRSLAKALLEAGADPDAPDGQGVAPIFAVTDDRTVELLLDAGATPTVGGNGDGPLLFRVETPRLIRKLAAKGCDVNGARGDSPLDQDGRTPLFSVRTLKAIRALVKLGGRLDKVDSMGRTPLMRTLGAPEVAEMLKAGVPADARDASGMTALMLSDDPEGVKALIRAGADANAQAKDGSTPLVPREFGDASSKNPFYRPARNPMVTKALLDAGAKPTYPGFEGVQPLAVSQGEAIDLLLKLGASPNATDHKGRTALMVACSLSDNLESVKALIRAGADVHARDPEGRTPLMYAVQDQWRCVADQRSATLTEADLLLCLDREPYVGALLEAGASVADMDNEGRTALSYCESFDSGVALVQAGADVNGLDRHGRNALMNATTADMAALLIMCGADVTLRDDQGWPVAWHMRAHGLEKTLRLSMEPKLRAGLLAKPVQELLEQLFGCDMDGTPDDGPEGGPQGGGTKR